MRWPELSSRELMFFVVHRRHHRSYHFSFKTSKPPCFGGELDYALDCNLDAFFFPRVSKMPDGIDDLFYNGTGSRVDALLCPATSKSSKQCLLAPDGFLSCTLISNVATHRCKQGVGFIVSTTQAEQEWTKNTIGDKFGNSMGNVCSAQLPRLCQFI